MQWTKCNSTYGVCKMSSSVAGHDIDTRVRGSAPTSLQFFFGISTAADVAISNRQHIRTARTRQTSTQDRPPGIYLALKLIY